MLGVNRGAHGISFLHKELDGPVQGRSGQREEPAADKAGFRPCALHDLAAEARPQGNEGGFLLSNLLPRQDLRGARDFPFPGMPNFVPMGQNSSAPTKS